jgi:hypothetical protein
MRENFKLRIIVGWGVPLYSNNWDISSFQAGKHNETILYNKNCVIQIGKLINIRTSDGN